MGQQQNKKNGYTIKCKRSPADAALHVEIVQVDGTFLKPLTSE